jgi:hypothetical protein
MNPNWCIYRNKMKPDWFLYTDKNNLNGNASYGGGNPKCFYAKNYEGNDNVKYKGKSLECSKEMYNDKVCFWHWVRMANEIEFVCGCGKNWNVAAGDAIGRHILRTYKQDFSMPVLDSIGKIYCCGECQNRDNEITNCGEMLICENCLHHHKNKE